MMFHIVLAAFLSFQLVGQFGIFYVVLCVVSFLNLDRFFNLCSLCCVMVFWFVKFCWFDSSCHVLIGLS